MKPTSNPYSHESTWPNRFLSLHWKIPGLDDFIRVEFLLIKQKLHHLVNAEEMNEKDNSYMRISSIPSMISSSLSPATQSHHLQFSFSLHDFWRQCQYMLMVYRRWPREALPSYHPFVGESTARIIRSCLISILIDDLPYLSTITGFGNVFLSIAYVMFCRGVLFQAFGS